jgi:hypothetical protein
MQGIIIITSSSKKRLHDIISSSQASLIAVMLVLNIASYCRAKVAAYDTIGALLNAAFAPGDGPVSLPARAQ